MTERLAFGHDIEANTLRSSPIPQWQEVQASPHVPFLGKCQMKDRIDTANTFQTSVWFGSSTPGKKSQLRQLRKETEDHRSGGKGSKGNAEGNRSRGKGSQTAHLAEVKRMALKAKPKAKAMPNTVAEAKPVAKANPAERQRQINTEREWRRQ